MINTAGIENLLRRMGNIMKSRILVSLLFLAACSSSTVGEDGGQGDGVFGLGQLEGTYDISAEVDKRSELFETETPSCVLNVLGSSVTANCTKTDGTDTETLVVDITITESQIEGDLTYTLDSPSFDTNCYDSFGITETIVGEVNKTSGAEVQGVFAPLAGLWSGDYTKVESFEFTLAANADSTCGGFEDTIKTFTFESDILGDSARVDWTAPGYGDNSFTVTANPDGSIAFIDDDETEGTTVPAPTN